MKQLEADSAKKDETFRKEDKDAILGVTATGFKDRTERQVVHANWFIGFGGGHVPKGETAGGFANEDPKDLQAAEDMLRTFAAAEKGG